MQNRLIFLDTETTGMTRDDRVIELGMVEVINGQITGNRFHSYIRTVRPIHWAASKVHGIRDRDLAGKPLFSALSASILDFIGDSRAFAHNAAFDGRMLNTEWDHANVPLHKRPKLSCTIRLVSPVTPGGAKLDDAMKHFLPHLPPRGNHSAVEDAEILARVFLEISKRHPDHAADFMSGVTRKPERVRSEPVSVGLFSETVNVIQKTIVPKAIPDKDVLSENITNAIARANESCDINDVMTIRTGRDAFSALKETDMRPAFSQEDLDMFDSVSEPKMRMAAMRMTLRGLRATLAVEREKTLAEMYESRSESPLY